MPINENKTDVLPTITLEDMEFKKVIAFIRLLLADVFGDEMLEWEDQLQKWTDVITAFIQLYIFFENLH